MVNIFLNIFLKYNGEEVKYEGLNLKPCRSHHRAQYLFLDLSNIHFLKTIVNSVVIIKLQKLFVKTNCVVYLSRLSG
jgi:hypothetical protein